MCKTCQMIKQRREYREREKDDSILTYGTKICKLKYGVCECVKIV